MPRPPPPEPDKLPLAFFITFHTYGTRLHGASAGSVDREHNQFSTPCSSATPGSKPTSVS